MKIVSAQREGKQLVVRTEPPLSQDQFDAFREFMLARGHRESGYSLSEGSIVVTHAWPFDLKKNMDELEGALRAAFESGKRQA